MHNYKKNEKKNFLLLCVKKCVTFPKQHEKLRS